MLHTWQARHSKQRLDNHRYADASHRCCIRKEIATGYPMAGIPPARSAVVGAVILGARPAGRRPPSPEDDGDGDECDGVERFVANQ